ncbi:DNA repair protein RecO (recombination protein O) [Dysgonomonas sp. PH5-45]|uniref:DNA repair protein RecO n=1 Tax=unclassified Dysgonomonas TaxID=2630389 RepID=UPI002473B30F|nr:MULTISPECIES: DNA repair protein RecO [unclassified Dysgonomonas]MDH6354268.1 DNA repair protein RecO (recombination protein O) [Dysgonomonas sp. PH5-45]MDH6387169.1 DNA repair protein RecO (recombination protein O) [Dysgonomonas sp. PH5-37]
MRTQIHHPSPKKSKFVYQNNNGVQHKTRGIVLNTINYNDKYMLAQIYTEHLGRVTYMIPKSKGKASKMHRSLFTPLSLLDMEVEHQTSRSIQRIKEARMDMLQNSNSSDMAKTAIVFFLSEFLSRVLKDMDENASLFSYLRYSIEILHRADKSIANFHLVFMLKLTRFLGFYPNMESYSERAYFDLLNGEFVRNQPLHNHYTTLEDSVVMARLARINYENMHLFRFSQNDRIKIIDRMVEYYRIHLNDFPPLKSLDVLHELF